MSDALTIAAGSMSHDMQRLATISHNLTNATTTGYKRAVLLGTPFEALLHARDSGNAGAPLPLAAPVLDFRPGSLRATGHALDLALEGAGFFELAAPDGPVYTRQGEFRRDASGRLVNAAGWPVMGSGGEIVLDGMQPRIERDGRVFEGDKLVGQLKIVDFADPQGLRAVGGAAFVATADNPALTREGRVRQGQLENANVFTAHEMVRLIETLRHFESNQRLIQGYDEQQERVIRSLGNMS